MASTDLIAKVQFLARKNGLNPDDYTELKILQLEIVYTIERNLKEN